MDQWSDVDIGRHGRSAITPLIPPARNKIIRSMKTIRSMKRGIALLLLLLGSWSVSSQETPPDAPVGRVPLTPVEGEPPAAIAAEPPPVEVDPLDAVEILPQLKGLIIVKGIEEMNPNGAPAIIGLQVIDIPLLAGAEFDAVVQPYFDRPLTGKAIKQLQREIILYCRNHDRPLVDVILPEQPIDNAVLYLVFLESRVGKVTIEGNKWFSEDSIRKDLRLQPGDRVSSGRLLDDLDWLNRNPFRQVNVRFKQGEELGQTDLSLSVEDRFPVRFYGGFENSGTRFSGDNRLLAGFNYGNLFGLGHQINYQYTTDLEFKFVKANSASYVAPLPWRHTLTLLGSYVDAKADFGEVAPGTESSGQSAQGSLRYVMPLPDIGKLREDFTLGFDFKRSNNDIEFGGQSSTATDTHILQFQAGYSSVLEDRWGQTSFGLEGYYSPGDLTSKNSDEAFELLRPVSQANYFYGRVSLERITRLPYDMALIVRGFGQVASDRLLPSEELGLGGARTIRGYDVRLVNGDSGFLLNAELRSPAIRLFSRASSKLGDDYLQLLGFFDYGTVRIADVLPDERETTSLSSIGVGLRYSFRKNLSFQFDYGFQLREKELSEDHSRGHIAMLMSF